METSSIENVARWYHSIEVAPGVVTPGLFDLRAVTDRIPWPDLTGKRCLDVATFDGFYAFEMERRGAAEVVATDLPDFAELDWLPGDGPSGPTLDGETGEGFRVAHGLLGSSVNRELVSVYDMTPDNVGTFDVVLCGALLLHLRDPWRALAAIRSVCTGVFLSIEKVDPLTDALVPRLPVQRIFGRERVWVEPNTAGHRRMLELGGFTIEETASLAMALGEAADAPSRRPGLAGWARQGIKESIGRMRYGGPGLPLSAVRAH